MRRRCITVDSLVSEATRPKAAPNQSARFGATIAERLSFAVGLRFESPSKRNEASAVLLAEPIDNIRK